MDTFSNNVQVQVSFFPSSANHEIHSNPFVTRLDGVAEVDLHGFDRGVTRKEVSQNYSS